MTSGVSPAAPVGAGLHRPAAVVRFIGKAVDWTVIGIGATMTVLVFVNVSLHLFDKDLAWVTELGELLMVWVTFLGGACATQRGVHMSINEFVDKLGDAGRRWADTGILAVTLVVLAVLTRYGWSLVDVNWENQLTVLGWPMAIQYMGMAVGCTLMSFFVAIDLYRTLRGVPRDQRYPKAD